MSSDIAEDIAVATVTATLRLVGFVHPEPFGSDALWLGNNGASPALLFHLREIRTRRC